MHRLSLGLCMLAASKRSTSRPWSKEWLLWHWHKPPNGCNATATVRLSHHFHKMHTHPFAPRRANQMTSKMRQKGCQASPGSACQARSQYTASMLVRHRCNNPTRLGMCELLPVVVMSWVARDGSGKLGVAPGTGRVPPQHRAHPTRGPEAQKVRANHKRLLTPPRVDLRTRTQYPAARCWVEQSRIELP
jgi:hypothetical protein